MRLYCLPLTTLFTPVDTLKYRSEEDNDPLTDDGASALSVPAISRPVNSRSPLPRSSRLKHAAIPHHLSELSDDGVDSPTYDGDIESSTTAAPAPASTLSNASASASASTMTSPASVVRELPPMAQWLPHLYLLHLAQATRVKCARYQ